MEFLSKHDELHWHHHAKNDFVCSWKHDFDYVTMKIWANLRLINNKQIFIIAKKNN